MSAAIGSTFLRWWGQELYGLLPGSTSPADAAGARSTVAVEADGVRLVETTALKSGVAPLAGTVAPQQMFDWLGGAVRGGAASRSICLRLPHAACFVRMVELPAVAKRDFAALLGVDMERSTPFKMRDILTAITVSDAASAKGMIRVRHLIIKRKGVADLKAVLDAAGFTLTRVECLDADGTVMPVNFLANETSDRHQPRRSSAASIVLAALATGLAASATYFYVDRHEQALQSLQAQTAQLKAKVRVQRDALAKAQAAFADIANFQKLRTDTPSKATILEELTHILPDTAWVTDMKLDNATIDISGLATSAAALVPLLERSKVFVDATSTASLTFDPREEKERFAIRARIRAAATQDGTKAAEIVR